MQIALYITLKKLKYDQKSDPALADKQFSWL